MNIIRKHICYISILAAIMLISLCGCTQSRPVVDEEYIEAELQERYGIEFICDSLKYSQHMYEAMCHPTDDPLLTFSCVYGVDGSLGYDNYVGAIIAREESICFSEYLGNALGESYVRGAYVLLIDYGEPGYIDSDVEICKFIKDNSFSIQKAYEIRSVDKLFFRIFINTEYCDGDFGTEYDAIKNAVDKMVSKYKELYDLGIYLDMDLYFVTDTDYKLIVEYYKGNNQEISGILERYGVISLQMGDSTNHQVTEDLWLSRDEYIREREEMK